MSGYRLWSTLYPAVPLLVMGWMVWRSPALGRARFRRMENGVGRMARYPWRVAAGVATASLTLSVAIALLVRSPQPVIADEFSYLLAAETFREGRVSNPPPPSWPHFESLHVLMQPTWASKYPPAQGLAMAAGWKLGGAPIVGVWISLALGCAAVYWMLLGWVRPREALVGGVLAVLHPMLLEWGQNFWGGAIALGGGALVLGATGRLRCGGSIRMGAVFGLGLAILAASRPFEGAVFGLLCGLLWLPALKRGSWREAWTTLLAVGAPLLPALLLLATYHARVTGNAWEMPYQVHERAYAVAPPFLWQPLREPPVYRHDSLRRFYTGFAQETHLEQQSLAGWLRRGLVRKLGILLRGYLGTAAMSLALLLLPWGLLARDRVVRPIAALIGLFLAILLGGTWVLPHYAAPAVGALFLLTVQGWRRLRSWSPGGRRRGLWLARAAILMSFLGVIHVSLRIDRDASGNWAWAAERTALAERLRAGGTADSAGNPARQQKWLVLVRYGPGHNPHEEWVYNSIDLAETPVLWAREMDSQRDQRLLAAFPDRQCRILFLNGGPGELLPCPATISPAPPSGERGDNLNGAGITPPHRKERIK